MTLFGRRIPMAFALVFWFVVWEIIGRLDLIMLIPPFTEILATLPEVVSTGRFRSAMLVTVQAFGIGMTISIVVGILLGIAMGRSRAFGDVMGMWVNIFESSPLSAVVPLLMAVIGFGMPTMVVTVVLFSIWVVALDTQVGVKHANQSLVEMARSFGASTPVLYRKIVFWSALPEVLAGIRLGLIRGVKGVIIGQLLIAIVGIGSLFELYSRNFLMPEFWSLILLVFGFAYAASELVGAIEKRVAYYAQAR